MVSYATEKVTTPPIRRTPDLTVPRVSSAMSGAPQGQATEPEQAARDQAVGTQHAARDQATLVGRAGRQEAVSRPTTARGSAIVVDAVAAHDLTPAQLSAWDQLYEQQQAPSNPFLSPAWVMEWYAKFVPDAEDRVVLVVSQQRGSDGHLDVVAISPMHVHRARLGPVRLARRLLPVGAGMGPNAFEIPGLLCRRDQITQAERAIVAASLELPVHWSELALTPEQGWLDGQCASGGDAPVAFGEFVRLRACVVLPLRGSWEETRATLKRNVKESVRRSANRLAKDGRPVEVRRLGEELDRSAVERFLLLHQARATLSRATQRHHPDAYVDERNRALMLDALPRLGREGRASMFELHLDGEHVASQLALHSPGTSYVHSSGFREDTWALGVVTHLQAELIQHAIDRGDTVINFSPGPNVSKTRWSDELWVTHEFVFGAGPRSLTPRFATFQMLSSLRATLVLDARRRAQLQSTRLSATQPSAVAG